VPILEFPLGIISLFVLQPIGIIIKVAHLQNLPFYSKFDPSDDAYVWDTVEESARDIINDANGNNMNTSNEKLDRNSEIISMLDGMGISKLTNVKVNHCFQAFGVRIWSKEGWSVVYSGDTRPCAELEELGRGATILIHEVSRLVTLYALHSPSKWFDMVLVGDIR
jgi:ribonuclease Z